jgi:hypothetical protein
MHFSFLPCVLQALPISENYLAYLGGYMGFHSNQMPNNLIGPDHETNEYSLCLHSLRRLELFLILSPMQYESSIVTVYKHPTRAS